MATKATGTVVSNKTDKTIVVKVDRRVAHPIYKKQFTKSNKFMAHDEKSEANIGDIVEIESVRPISKNKNWKLVRVVTKAKKLGGDN